MTQETLYLLIAIAVIFAVAYLLFKFEVKNLKDDNARYLNDLQAHFDDSAFKLQKQNKADQQELSEATLDMMENIKKELHHTKEKTLEGATVTLQNNGDHTVSLKVVKVKYDV